MHTLDSLRGVRKALDDRGLSTHHIPDIKDEDSCSNLAERLHPERKSDPYSVEGILTSFYQENKSDIAFLVGLSFLKTTFEVAGLLLIQVLINLVSDPKNLSHAQIYLVVGAIGICWLLKSSCNHNIMLEGILLPAKVKGGLILIMTRKILGLSQHAADLNEVGRITNIISNDFNRIEDKFRFAVQALPLPIQFIIIIVIVFCRVGWMGSILFLIIVLAIAFQFLLSKLEAKYQVEVNAHKDSRIKAYTELLEGIRIIKLYAWEMAFRDMIQEIRKL